TVTIPVNVPDYGGQISHALGLPYGSTAAFVKAVQSGKLTADQYGQAVEKHIKAEFKDAAGGFGGFLSGMLKKLTDPKVAIPSILSMGASLAASGATTATAGSTAAT